MRILKPWIPAILWAGLILFASGDRFSAESSGSLFQAVFGLEPPPWLHFVLRKLTHLVVYAILAILVCRADRRWTVVMAIVIAVAVTDESLQTRSAARTGSVVDVGIDAVGAVLARIALESQSRKVSKSQRKGNARL